MGAIRALASDAVIELDGEVVLLKRNHSPCKGLWVLPGGLVELDETAREACVRETQEEVGLDVSVEEFIGLYDDPKRDERGNVSAAYRCFPRGKQPPTPRAEALKLDTFDPENLPAMGFDHKQIVTDTFLE